MKLTLKEIIVLFLAAFLFFLVVPFIAILLAAEVEIDNAAPTNITTTAAYFNGTVVATNATNPTLTLYYGTSDAGTNAGSWEFTNSYGVASTGAVSTNITGLTPAQLYYYRWYALDTVSNQYDWADSTTNFWTLAGVPTGSPPAHTYIPVMAGTNGVLASPTNFFTTNGVGMFGVAVDSNEINWASMPSGLQDGDDDTTYSAGTGIVIVAGVVSVSNIYGKVASSNAWTGTNSFPEINLNGTFLGGLIDDSMADALHRHSELSASDGTPNPAVWVDANGNVGIGTNAPSKLLDVAGTIECVQFEAFNDSRVGVTSGGSLKFGSAQSSFIYGADSTLQFKTASTTRQSFDNSGNVIFNSTSVDSDFTVNWDTGTGLFVQGSDGNVGIGTNAPAEPLEIVADTGHDNLRLTENSGGEYWNLGIDADGDLNFEEPVGTIRMTLEDGGNVGIGTNAPGAKLHVEQSAAADAFRVNDAAGDTTPFVINQSGYVGIGKAAPSAPLHVWASATGLRFEDSDAASVWHEIGSSGNTGMQLTADAANNAAGSFMAFRVDTSETMRIDVNGNVGIGTNAPATKLDVNGSFFGRSTAIWSNAADSTTSFQIFDADGGTPVVNVDTTNERLGIGTASPQQALHLATGQYLQKVGTGTWVMKQQGGGSVELVSSGSVTINKGGANSLIFGESGTEQMRIDASGNVGIGTNAPATKLHLNGAMTLQERTSQPSDPAEGHCVIWLTDGTGYGDDGDLCIITQAGGVLYTNTIVDVVP